MDNTNDFSFIIISYNRAEVTIEAINNIVNLIHFETKVREIIVLNNGSSTDYSSLENHIDQLLMKFPSKIKYIRGEENLGVSGGRNLCIKKAKGYFLFFLDDDAEIKHSNAIEIITNIFAKNHNEIGLVGFVAYNPLTKTYENPLKRTKLKDFKEDTYNNLFFGYGHVFPKSLISKTGLYQEDFFYGMEEYDLSYGAIKAGYKILICKEILIHHKINPAGREIKKVTYKRMFENKVIVAYKHLASIYVLSHFILWSLYLLTKTRFDHPLYFKALKSLKLRLVGLKRIPMNIKGTEYLKGVRARLWY